MMKMKSFVALLLACLLCLGTLFGCAQPGDETDNIPDDNSSHEGESNETPAAQIALVEGGTPRYAIVRSDLTESSSTETKLSMQIKKALQAVTGVEFTLYTDWEGKDSNADMVEILVGKTNRAESESAMAALQGEDDYLIRADGNKIVIVANHDEALAEAVNYFLAT